MNTGYLRQSGMLTTSLGFPGLGAVCTSTGQDFRKFIFVFFLGFFRNAVGFLKKISEDLPLSAAWCIRALKKGRPSPPTSHLLSPLKTHADEYSEKVWAVYCLYVPWAWRRPSLSWWVDFWTLFLEVTNFWHPFSLVKGKVLFGHLAGDELPMLC